MNYHIWGIWDMHVFEPEWRMMRRGIRYLFPFAAGLLLKAVSQATAVTTSNEMQATGKYAATARKE